MRSYLLIVALILSAPVAAQRGRGPAQVANSPEVARIVAGYINARGGLEKWKAVSTIRMTGRVVIQSFEAPILILSKRPDRSRQEITVQGKQIINGFDGTTAWAVNPLQGGSSAPETMSGPDALLIRDQSDFDGPLVDYQARGAQIVLVGHEVIGEQKVYHLRITRKNLPIVDDYLDETTFLEARVVTLAGTGQRLTVDLAKYKSVDGIMMPTSMRSLADGTLVSEITIDEVALNAPIDDAVFKVPGKQ